MRPVLLALPRLATIALVGGAAACTAGAPPPPSCAAPAYYAVTQVQVPWRVADGVRLGLDLDGDGQYDDAYGNMAAAIHSAEPGLVDPSGPIAARLARHDAIWLVGVAPCSGGQEALSLRRGADADGDGVPEVVGTAAAAYAAVGADAQVIARGGEADAPVTLLTDPVGTFAPIAWRTGERSGWNVHVDAGVVDGVVGFALRMPDATDDIIAPYAAYLTAELAAGTSPYAAKLDADHDGKVSLAELANDDLTRTLLLPDLQLDDGSGGLSFGFGVHAVATAVE